MGREFPARVARILLVEDDPQDVEITRRAFDRAKIGNSITVVTDGESALERLTTTRGDVDDRFDMVLLDLGLPKMDGRTLLREIYSDKRLRHIPVVVLTGSNDENDLINAYKGGAVAFLRKPVNVDRLLNAIGDLHGYRLYIARYED
ncbi:MAG: response regulator [Deltaproteobacteria bacterium]|nr:response regulator [Deltaproteobacteria bacterium]